MRYFIELSYLGKAYNGWQIQPNAPSVQQTLQKALSTLLRRTTETVGAGRTDTGVHASHYVAHFDTEMRIDRPVDFCYHLNALLPHDIAIQRIRPVLPTAHARFDALFRSYEYCVSLRKDPFRIDTAYQVNWPLDLDKMNEAAALLLTHRDFTSFCKLHSDNKTNLCRVSHAAWKREREDLLLFSITADRFLREVDAACVYANVSTAFTDGAQFGFGAEIGISTQKLHARGPMALPELNTYKYVITGDGQIRVK